MHGKKYFNKKMNSKYFKALIRNNTKIMEVLV